ncbi:hypothetical protein [Hyphomonas sp. GM-8P]|uniref:hypothetical protein n=1 Tax=Hyphomonas sp. GM-8P TaxID=1280945 RepID=UPI001313F9CB|nr:hypothetical protein [Hyphomonas sp. GM-8P]
MNAANQILQLQREQNRHDAGYHPDILFLDTASRMKHMALHHAKYTARFLGAEEDGDDVLFERTFTDAAIISVATANIFAQDLRHGFQGRAEKSSTLMELGQVVAHTPKTDLRFVRRYSEQAGAMAKACESFDHVEDFPFRKALLAANENMFGLLVETAAVRKLDFAHLYMQRLKDIESNSPRSLLLE